MLEAQTSEADLVQRISRARGTSEPELAPTENLEVVDVSEDEAPEEPVVEEEAQAETDDTAESEELEATSDETVATSDEGEDLYVEYEGREINLKDIAEWEQGHLRQSDYTRKTQEVAESRKALEADQAKLADKQQALNASLAELEAILAEETLTSDKIAELREYEPEEYIKYQEKIAKRKEIVAKARDQAPNSSIDTEEEGRVLHAAHPEWVADGKFTDAYSKDMAAISEAGKALGYSDAELQGINQARHFEALILAGRAIKSSRSNAAIEKKVRKAPVTTKPRAATSSNLQTQIKQAQARLKETGSTDDAVKLRQLKRQLQR